MEQQPALVPALAPSPTRRYWTLDEHARYLVGFHIFGHHNIPDIATTAVVTRNVSQVRSHQQKTFERIIRNTKKHVRGNNREGEMGPYVPIASTPWNPVSEKRYVPSGWGLVLLATTAEELMLGGNEF